MKTKSSVRWHSSFIILVLLAILVSSCGGSKASAPKDKVSVQFSWFHSAEFLGFYVADQLGYYANANLDVTLLAGGPEVDPVAAVIGGKSQFGVTSGDAIIRARSAGQDLVGVASVFRKSPLIIMALADSGITSPKDLVGKRVGVISPKLDTTWDIQFIAMLKKLKIDPASITFVPNQEFHGAADLLSGRMDATSSCFLTNEAVQAKIDGNAVNSIYYSDYGIEFYNDVIFTNSKLAAENPDLVRRFVQATLQGYQYAIEHPKEAAALTVKYDKTLDVAFQQATMEAQVPLIDTGDVSIGTMDSDIWTNTQAVLIDQGIISAPVDLTKVYTNDFIKK